MPKYSVGFVYVMSNPAMPGRLKIGRTGRLAEDRAKDLYTTGVPFPFHVEHRTITSHPAAVERKTHAALASMRPEPGREFFCTSVQCAREAIEAAALSSDGISGWQSDDIHQMDCGDRAALRLKENDLLIIIASPDALAQRSEVVDIWQGHSDGDLLELMGTEHPGHVAGIGDSDCPTDPVPFLDRHGSAPNGTINGLDRLTPGDRLLWFSETETTGSYELVVFEFNSHCQVISRTRELKVDPNGFPCLLNVLTLEHLPQRVVDATRKAMRMKRPRHWAPRDPDPMGGWAATGTDQPPPEHWLRQLAPPNRRNRKSKRD